MSEIKEALAEPGQQTQAEPKSNINLIPNDDEIVKEYRRKFRETNQRFAEQYLDDNSRKVKTDRNFRLVTLEEIANQSFDEVPAIIDGLLDVEESLLLVGSTGIGKSLLTLNIAACLAKPPANGLWGKFPIPKQRKVLIIQSEVGSKGLNKRLKILSQNEFFREAIRLVFIPQTETGCRTLGSLKDEEFRNQLLEMIKMCQAEVVIVDPLSSYHGQDNESGNAEMRQSLDLLTAICDQVGCVPIVVHHAGKGGIEKEIGGRGATSIGDWAANILLLEQDRLEDGEAIIKIHHRKARNFELVPDFYLRRTKTLDFLLEDRSSHELKKIVEVLSENGGTCCGQNKLCKLLEDAANWSSGKSKNLIKKAVSAGLIQETQKDREYVYSIKV
jgi:archaellum biogenesis ATPase FlaH